MKKIPVYQPSLGGKEREYVLECLDSTWISSRGRFISAFESEFSRFTGISHATSVFNGTVAMHLCMLALGLGPGDEVIVPTFTYIASVNCIRYVGARPVFVDSRPDTWQMDPAEVERRITPATKAVLAVHLYGLPCDLAALRAICDKHGLFLVEDCAEAFGSLVGDAHVGTTGDISGFSFFGNKTITTGEGGMVATPHLDLHQRIAQLKNQGLSRHQEYWHDIVGYNFRMTNIQAAIGLAQLETAARTIQKKRSLASRYMDQLGHIPGLAFQAEQPGMRHSYWMVSILVPDASLRQPLREHLSAAGIETRPTFPPVHKMPPYADAYQRFPVADALGSRGINLPSWPDLPDEDFDLICTQISEFLERSRS